MAPDNEELNQRRRKRELLRQQRLARQKKLIWGLAASALVLVLCGILIFTLARDSKNPGTADPPTPVLTDPVPQETKVRQDKTVIHLTAAGDVNVTDKTVAAAQLGTGYDYTRVFMDVTPLLTDSDLTVVNFEGNLCGAPYGSQTTSAPQALMEALADSGVDLVQMANSCSINNGLIGLSQTLTNIRAEGMEPLGAYASPEEFQTTGGYSVREVDGIRIAFVAFTKGMGNLGLPEGNEDCINLLYTDYDSTYRDVDSEGISRLLRRIQDEESPDLTVALLHWGSEYNDQISPTQESIEKLMLAEGVDVILGTHSHYVQQMKLDREAGTFVAYSLGDLLSDAERPGSDYSVVLDLEITRDNITGITKVTGFEYHPICIQSTEDSLQVVRLDDAIAAYEADNIQRISEEEYKKMIHARQRIEERIHPAEK